MQNFVPHSVLGHRERRFFAIRKLKNSIALRLVYGLPQFPLSLALIKQASFFMFQKKNNFVEESLDIYAVFSSGLYPLSNFRVGAMMIKRSLNLNFCITNLLICIATGSFFAGDL